MLPDHRELSGNYKSFHDGNNKLFNGYQAEKISQVLLAFCSAQGNWSQKIQPKALNFSKEENHAYWP
jgi:hypothetical protein